MCCTEEDGLAKLHDPLSIIFCHISFCIAYTWLFQWLLYHKNLDDFTWLVTKLYRPVQLTIDKHSVKEMFTEQTRYAKWATSKERKDQQRGKQHQENKKEFQNEINDFLSLQPTLWQEKEKKKASGFHYLKDLILLPWLWKTIWRMK